ncbi:hypothetical protein Patl1_21676 [Pistacia atlantica]|uniref:Uncharacterized protein n=1 Tax=Pistacia atlantica TaxID=434234 RepID=A0ACC1BP10_9ROSI|nr:hypothetical protein Patl1_21676 [Pistacia atlantica]
MSRPVAFDVINKNITSFSVAIGDGEEEEEELLMESEVSRRLLAGSGVRYFLWQFEQASSL